MTPTPPTLTRAPRAVRTEAGRQPPPDLSAGSFAAKTLGALLGVTLAGTGFAILLALVASEWEPLDATDQAIVDATNAVVGGSPSLATVAKIITQLGSPIGVTIVVVVTVVWLLIRRLPRLAAYVAVAGLGAAVLGPGVKALVERARPIVDVPLSSPTGDSFPSGHSIGIMIGWGALLVVFLPVVPRNRRWLAVAVMAGVIVLVGLSRIALGVHYPSDVVGGWLLGLVWLAVTAAAFRSSRPVSASAFPPQSLDALAPRERRSLHPAPAHDRALPAGAATASRLLVAGVLLCGALISVGLLITGSSGAIQRFDQSAVTWFQGLDGKLVVIVAGVIGWLGGVSGNLATLAIAIPLTTAITRRWAPAMFLLVASGGQALIYLASSRIVGRDRPAIEGDMLAIVSFPSGHVGASVATYGGIALLVLAWANWRFRYAVAAPALLIVLGVAFSRLHKGVHYPSDVVAGLIYGSVWLVLCWTWIKPARQAPHDPDAEPAGEASR